jgi:ADP-heptose:LPS heptosyltransferase
MIKARRLLSLAVTMLRQPRYLLQLVNGLPLLLSRRFLFRDPLIYVRRYAGIGDIVCTLPSVGVFRRNEPRAIIVYETRHSFMPLLRRCDTIDLVTEQESPLARVCRKIFRPSVDIRPVLPDERIPKQAQGLLHLEEEFRRSFGFPKLRLDRVNLRPSKRASRQIRSRLRRAGLAEATLIVIHTGPSWTVREWPAESWTELVTRLKSSEKVKVVQIGENNDATGAERLSSLVSGATNWIGKLSLDQMLALLGQANLFVGIDSGMLHLAGAVGTPCVGVFGPTKPEYRLPRHSPTAGAIAQVDCAGCHHRENGPRHWESGCPNGIRCMLELTTADVFEKCARLLGLKYSKPKVGILPSEEAETRSGFVTIGGG